LKDAEETAKNELQTLHTTMQIAKAPETPVLFLCLLGPSPHEICANSS
jgi:hypothetical protein